MQWMTFYFLLLLLLILSLYSAVVVVEQLNLTFLLHGVLRWYGRRVSCASWTRLAVSNYYYYYCSRDCAQPAMNMSSRVTDHLRSCCCCWRKKKKEEEEFNWTWHSTAPYCSSWTASLITFKLVVAVGEIEAFRKWLPCRLMRIVPYAPEYDYATINIWLN